MTKLPSHSYSVPPSSYCVLCSTYYNSLLSMYSFTVSVSIRAGFLSVMFIIMSPKSTQSIGQSVHSINDMLPSSAMMFSHAHLLGTYYVSGIVQTAVFSHLIQKFIREVLFFLHFKDKEIEAHHRYHCYCCHLYCHRDCHHFKKQN